MASCYEVVDVNQWLSGWANHNVGGASGVILPLVDLRSYDDFDEQHLSCTPAVDTVNEKTKTAESTSEKDHITIVNLPMATLLSGERSCELPPRHVEFAILVPTQYAKEFHKNQDCPIHQLFFASQSKTTMQSRKPWLVRQVLIEEDALWKTAGDLGFVQSCGKGSCNGNEIFPFRSHPRLWKPDPLVSSDILPLLKVWLAEKNTSHSDESYDVVGVNNATSNGMTTEENSIGLVLDLGSGAGRDICYLAEELKQCRHSLLEQQRQQQQQQSKCMRSIHFIGIDNHKGSAKRCLPLWTNRGVHDVTESCNIDLNKLHRVRDHFMNVSKMKPQTSNQSTILCIFAIRFLNRRLLSYISNSQSMQETNGNMHVTNASQTPPSKRAKHAPPPPLVLPLGTLIAISHFCKSEEGASWNFDHPKESSVLDRWELKKLFNDAVCSSASGEIMPRWEILKDDIVPDGDHGRTLIQFVARKVA